MKLSYECCQIPDVVGSALQKVFPISRFPESETFHFDIVITHRSISIRCALEIKVDEFFQIRTDDLISINKNDLLEIHGEENIEEKDLVCPDDTLLLFLSTKPRRPFICH